MSDKCLTVYISSNFNSVGKFHNQNILPAAHFPTIQLYIG